MYIVNERKFKVINSIFVKIKNKSE